MIQKKFKHIQSWPSIGVTLMYLHLDILPEMAECVGGTARYMGTTRTLGLPMSLSCVWMSHVLTEYHYWEKGGELLLLDTKDAFYVWLEVVVKMEIDKKRVEKEVRVFSQLCY